MQQQHQQPRLGSQLRHRGPSDARSLAQRAAERADWLNITTADSSEPAEQPKLDDDTTEQVKSEDDAITQVKAEIDSTVQVKSEFEAPGWKALPKR